jgi:hypothetical protein
MEENAWRSRRKEYTRVFRFGGKLVVADEGRSSQGRIT